MSAEVMVVNPAGPYNPSRDFAKVWPRLLKEAAALVVSPPPGSPVAIVKAATGTAGRDNKDFQEVFCLIAVAALTATERKERLAYKLLSELGVFQKDPAILAVVITAIGQIVTGVIISSAGDLKFSESEQLFQAATDVKDIWSDHKKD